MKDQVRISETELDVQDCIVSSIPSLCPIVHKMYRLQGIYFKKNYKFIEILVNKCTGEAACAPLSVINGMISSGEFRIRALVSIESEQFDVERFHETGSGFAISNRSFEYYGLPNVEVHSDIYMQARRISKEQRYIGSPPLPQTEINVLSLRGRETNYLPRTTNETNLMTFVIRVADNVKLEEVSYWCPSVLDLFALWGAMASFAATLSLGFIAYQYNKWNFNRHFYKATIRKRREAQQQNLATIQWLRNTQNFNSTPNRDHMYKNLQEQYDALMIEPDIRLFETHHFDTDGRMAMTAAEIKFPSTPYGELRLLAIQEHSKKKRAAEFLSIWYARHLVRKGFIKDERRRRELFAPVREEVLGARDAHGLELYGRRFHLQSLRRRKRRESKNDWSSSNNNNNNADAVSWRCDDLEHGVQTNSSAMGTIAKGSNASDHESNSQTSISVQPGDFKDNDDENTYEVRNGAQTNSSAIDVIAKDNASSDKSNTRTSICVPSGELKDDRDDSNTYESQNVSNSTFGSNTRFTEFWQEVSSWGK